MKSNLFDLPFITLDQKSLLAHISALPGRSNASSVVFANAHVIVEANRSKEYKNLLKKVDCVVPDGVPIQWVFNAKGVKSCERYSGPDLMEDVFESAKGAKHFFIGSTQATLDKIKEKFKGNAVGFYSPPFAPKFSEEELTKQLKMVEESKADFVWVGLGAPKQERFVVEMAGRSKHGAWLAVGAAFDFYAGLKPRAPKWMQKAGMEWFFRMSSEPKRLAKRYLSTNPEFIGLAVKELLKR